MPECRDRECHCGHLDEMHKDHKSECLWWTCTCLQFNECSAADMFVMKGRKPFAFSITGRGMCPENMDLNDVKVYIQGLLSHADKNIIHKLDYPPSIYNNKPGEKKGREFLFSMITRVGEYQE